MLSQLEARMKMMSGGSKLRSHHRLGVSNTLPEAIEKFGTFINQNAPAPGRAMALAHLWWEHVLGEDDARLCFQHRLAYHRGGGGGGEGGGY